MATETTYTSLRENLASILDQVVDQQETVIEAVMRDPFHGLAKPEPLR